LFVVFLALVVSAPADAACPNPNGATDFRWVGAYQATPQTPYYVDGTLSYYNPSNVPNDSSMWDA